MLIFTDTRLIFGWVLRFDVIPDMEASPRCTRHGKYLAIRLLDHLVVIELYKPEDN